MHMTKNPLVTVSIITHNRPDDLADTIANVLAQTYRHIEVLVIENGSEPAVINANRKRLESIDCLRYIPLVRNLGVSGGRRVALENALGDYIIEIDDDAVFEKPDAIDRAVDCLESNLVIGILAFKITNYHTGRIVPSEFPFRDKNRDPELAGLCTWFIGAGHAFRRSAIEHIGTYRDFFPWGSEEQDLALRTLDAGYEIMYFPDVNVLHKKSPTARIENERMFAAIRVKNRVKVALLNLPWYSVITYFIVRTGQFMLQERNPFLALRVLHMLAKEWDYIRKNRRVISRETQRRLRERKGQLYF